ncbi:diacylglycerol kinase [Methylogaea oryzae]|uniref:Diacylglycerol kinase n=1 Tax=Methylogaea oryzae TaxID=1295382 RepID=A0A8D5ALH3_9GAMM|nr:diacylglycerol kinase [Methylogaea oryzae]BBL70125.1 diacylglycerol kinase [Methylogaea oryzae]
MSHPYKIRKGLFRVYDALGFTLAGLRYAVVSEEAFRLEVLLVAPLLPLALWLTDDGLRRAMLIGSLLLILIVELLNSAVEATVDRVSLERHPLAKVAKDMGSAAVALAMLNAAVTWALLLLP